MKFKGTEIYYSYKKGKKTPVVLLHGWGCDSTLYKGILKDFESVLVLDFPPFGKSDKLKMAWTIYDYKDLVLEILKLEGIKKAKFLCHSFGARVAMLLASQTDVVESMVIIGGAGLKNKSIKVKFKIAKYKLAKKLNLTRKNAGSLDYQNLDDIMKATFKNIVNTDLKFCLKNIDAKTLLIYGQNDKETPVKYGKIFNKGIKNSSLCVVDGAGHFCFLEKPLKVRKLIKDFYSGENL